jgi:hypothetical protein
MAGNPVAFGNSNLQNGEKFISPRQKHQQILMIMKQGVGKRKPGGVPVNSKKPLTAIPTGGKVLSMNPSQKKQLTIRALKENEAQMI